MSSCAKDFGVEFETEDTAAARNNYSGIPTVDTVYLDEENNFILLDDTINCYPQNIVFSRSSILRQKVVEEKIISDMGNYFVYRTILEIDLLYCEKVIPIIFVRERALAKESAEKRLVNQFKVSSVYRRTDAIVSDDDSCSRSYYDLSINLYDNNLKLIGTIYPRVSFFTANVPISFKTRIVEETSVTVEI